MTIDAFNTSIKSKSIKTGLIISIIGWIVLIIPPFSKWEQSLGLGYLFQIRGLQKTPNDIAIVSIDKKSSQQFGIPNQPSKWPRFLHANALNNLKEAGVAAIGMDILFTDQRPSNQDQAFLHSLKNAGNVILFEYLHVDETEDIYIEKRRSPRPEFKNAALAVAPYVLPKVPEKIYRSWLFKTGAGDSPTIPVLMLFQYHRKHLPGFIDHIQEALAQLDIQTTPPNPEYKTLPLTKIPLTLKALFDTYPQLQEKVQRKIDHIKNQTLKQAHQSLLFTLTVGNNILLNYYGPPQSIETWSYHQILEEDISTLKDKAIFIGFSEHLQPEQKDGFYTIYTNKAGLDISGVEIMATTLANLLESRTITPLPLIIQILLITAFGLLAPLLLIRFPGLKLLFASLFLAFCYLAISSWAFSQFAYWVPLVTPLLVQLPLIIVIALLIQYTNTLKQRVQLDQAMRQYVPPQVVDAALDIDNEPHASSKHGTFAACMATDIYAYTQISERLSPESLHAQLNQYFSRIFPTIYHHNGLVIDVVGDAMLAIWHQESKENVRKQALLSALNIQKTLNKHYAFSMVTRMGLHCGEVSLGNVGSGDHVEYRAVGDIVNTTTRIEQLNKSLGTKLLVSGDIISSLDSFDTRAMGHFYLKGKQVPIAIYELSSPDTQNQEELHQAFQEALQLFQSGNFSRAEQQFKAIDKHFNDSPAQFYAKKCRENQIKTNNDWDGTIEI